MKTKYKYVHFHKMSRRYYVCHRNTTEITLGFISHFTVGRKRWLFIMLGGYYEEGEVRRLAMCLHNIASFLDQLNKAGKA